MYNKLGKQAVVYCSGVILFACVLNDFTDAAKGASLVLSTNQASFEKVVLPVAFAVDR